MGDDFIFTICCPSCGNVIGKSFKGARTFTRCPRCSADLYYEIDDSGIVVKIRGKPKSPPEVPSIPA